MIETVHSENVFYKEINYLVEIEISDCITQPVWYLYEKACSDPSNIYKDNYNIEILNNQAKDVVFFATFICNGMPLGVWSVVRDPTFKPSVIRTFYRYYIHAHPPFATDLNNLNKFESLYGVGFHKSFPKYHENFGAETIFFTRNVKKKKTTMDRIIRKYDVPFKRLEDIKIYRSVPQHIYVWGDATELERLPNYEQ